MLLLELHVYSQRQIVCRKWKVQSSIITSFQVSKRSPLCPESSSVIKISGPVFGPLPPKACGGNIFCTFSRHCLMTCCDCPDVIHTPTFVVAEHQQGDVCTWNTQGYCVGFAHTKLSSTVFVSIWVWIVTWSSRLCGGLDASAWIVVVAILLPFCLLWFVSTMCCFWENFALFPQLWDTN